MIRSTLTSLCCATALAVPVGNALALGRTMRSATTAPKKIVKTETIDGPSVEAHSGGYLGSGHVWGYLEVQLKLVKTEVITGPHASVSIKITAVNWPIFPNHTSRSIYINQQALPLLQSETMQLQASAGSKLINISGASNTTVAWQASLQAALLQAEKP
jgi:uncharacterized protein with FMN-binding domain